MCLQASKRPSIIALLLSAKANPNAADKARSTPLHRWDWAAWLSRLHHRAIPDRLPTCRACSAGKLEAVKALVQAKCRLDAKDLAGMTALSVAAQCGHSACALFLASKGADIEVCCLTLR